MNAVSFAGYTDWRAGNVFELYSLVDEETATGLPDAVAFPSWYAFQTWTSTTVPSTLANAFQVYYSDGYVSNSVKTSTYGSAYVRG